MPQSQSGLLLIERDFGQDWRFDDVFGFLELVRRMEELPAWIHEVCGNEDDQVPLDVLIDIRAEETVKSLRSMNVDYPEKPK